MFNRTETVSKKIQEKIKAIQEANTCDSVKYLVYDFINYKIDECGLGCQLHGFSSGLLCAIENGRQYSIINYYDDQYRDYFHFFNSWCKLNDRVSAGKLGESFFDIFKFLYF